MQKEANMVPFKAPNYSKTTRQMYWKSWKTEHKNLPKAVKKTFKQDHKFQDPWDVMKSWTYQSME